MNRYFRVLLAVILVPAAASALVRSYAVDPRTAAMSGWTSWQEPNNWVSEVITVNFDKPILASLFVGAKQGDGAYNVNIYSYPDGNIALAQAVNIPVTGSHYWLNCSLTVAHPDSFIKGRQVEVRWTRSGSDSINFYYNAWVGTKFDTMIVGGGYGEPIPSHADLACRIFGQMDAVDEDYWSAEREMVIDKSYLENTIS